MTHPIRPLYDFPYGPLKTDRHEIRLIQLKAKTHEPNQSDCALYVDLIHAERGHCQSYTALSYAWGRNNDQAPLRIRDRQYYINERVDAALRQLQDKDSDVFVWVDQICINQQDDVEKCNQVQQMKEIYSEAETVVVWLGPAENGSDRLLKHLGRMGTLIWSGDHQRVFAPHQTKDAIEAIEPAFRFLCERDYWKRLWIMQEYTVASRLKIACGSVMIWDWQLQAVFVFINKLSMNHQAGSSGGSDLDSIIRDMVRIYKTPTASFMEGVVTRRNRYWRRTDRDSDSLFQVLITILVLEQDYNFPLATDPRDRIFSVLQLAKDTAEFSAFPDYTWTCERVYREAALTMLKQGHIDILAYCQFPRDSSDIPSWAPDWRMMIRSPCTGPPWVNDFSASGQTVSQQSVSSPSTGIVTLQGIIVGSVKECESIWDPDWSKPLDHASAMEYLEHVRVMCEKSPTISQKPEREKGLVCLSIASCRRITDNTSSGISADTHRGTLDERRSLIPSAQVSRITKGSTTKLERILWTLFPGGTHGPRDAYMEQLRFLHRRRPFISDAGFIGTIPSFAQPGDVLCIFLGGKVPYVIRPAKDQSDTYTLIGEAFVYGLMDGEFLRDVYVAQSITLR